MVQPIVIVTVLVQILTFGGFLAEQSQLISHQPIRALAGNDVILPCHLEPPMDASSETVIWTRPDLYPEYVHFHQDEGQVCSRQNTQYHYRTNLINLINGDISLILSSVTVHDTGKYFCSIESLQKGASVQLTVDALDTDSELISDDSVIALAGDDVVLTCYLSPPISVSSSTVLWTRPALYPMYVYVYFQGQQVCQRQHPSYYNRTTMCHDELKNGNISMKISRVKPSDTGEYFCILESMMKEASIQLTVGVVSTPVIEFVSNQSREVVLQCEAKGWYPEPEVFWLDAEENLLSAGPTETVRGPDDLYTVSRRLTVEKSDSFICRVQQKNITQTRETHFYVPDHFFTLHSSLGWIWIVPAFALLSLLLLFIFCKIEKKCRKGNPEEQRIFPMARYSMRPYNTQREAQTIQT